MSKEEILESNKLIAEFMGGLFKSNKFTINDGWVWLPFENMCKITSLRYNSSWDWLMPVVEKIEKIIWNKIDLTEEVIINGLSCRIPIKDDAFISIKNTKIEATYDCVVEFIKWYNNQKLTNETN